MFLNALKSLYSTSVHAGTWLPTVSGHNAPAYIQHYISCNKLHQATPTYLSPTAALILHQGNGPIFSKMLQQQSTPPPQSSERNTGKHYHSLIRQNVESVDFQLNKMAQNKNGLSWSSSPYCHESVSIVQSNWLVVIDWICVCGCVGVHVSISLPLDQGETFSFKSHSYDD